MSCLEVYLNYRVNNSLLVVSELKSPRSRKVVAKPGLFSPQIADFESTGC